jgi:hypothetical protein
LVVPFYGDILKESPRNGAGELIKRGMALDPLARGPSILRERFADTLKLLMAFVAVLLLMVSSNVTGLLLARTAARRGEIAVRLAVGATRARLVRQMLADVLDGIVHTDSATLQRGSGLCRFPSKPR